MQTVMQAFRNPQQQCIRSLFESKRFSDCNIRYRIATTETLALAGTRKLCPREKKIRKNYHLTRKN